MGTISTNFEFNNISKSQSEIDNLSTSLDKLIGKFDTATSKLRGNPVNFGGTFQATTTDADKLTASVDKLIGKFEDFVDKLSSSSNKPKKPFRTTTDDVDALEMSIDKLGRQNLTSQKSALSLATAFNKLGKDGSGFKNEAIQILDRLRAIDAQLKRKPSPENFKSLTKEANELKADLAELNRVLIHLKSQNLTIGGRGLGSFNSVLGSLPGGNIWSGILAGGVAGGVAAGLTEVISLTKRLGSVMIDVGIDAVKTGAEFESTYKSIAVFAGGINQAKAELQSLDNAILRAKGIRLDVAESGYNSLRALNFAPDVAQNLTVGLGLQKRLSNVDELNIQRVLVNFQQIQATRDNFTRDFKEIIHAIPTLKTAFQNTFGTLDRSKLKDIFEADTEGSFRRLGETLANTKVAQEGLTTATIDFQNQGLIAKRIFAEPILDPWANSIKGMANILEQNKDVWRDWGEFVGNVIRGVNEIAIKPPEPKTPAERFEKGFWQGVKDAYNQPMVKEGLKLALGVASPLIGTALLLERIGANQPRAAFGEMGLDVEDPFKDNEESFKKLEKEYKFRLEIEKNIYSSSEAMLKSHLAIKEVDEITSLRTMNNFKNNILQQQIEDEKKYYAQQIANADGNTEKIQELMANLTKSVLAKNLEIKTNTLNTQAEIAAKSREFGKTLTGVFDNLFTKVYSDNPIAQAMMEGERSIRQLKDTLKTLPPEFQKVGREAVEMQKKINNQNKLKAIFDNQLSVIDLRNDAYNFRNPFDADEFKRKEQDFINTYLHYNPNYLFQKQNEYNRRQMLNPFNTYKSFDEEIREEILKFSGKALDSPKYRLNQQIEDKFNNLYGNDPKDDQLTAADRSFISVIKGVNPVDLNYGMREQAARALEREAARQAKFQTDSLRVMGSIEAIVGQIKTAQSEAQQNSGNNSQGVEVIVRDETSNQKVAGATTRPNAKDTAKHYSLGTSNVGGVLTNMGSAT